MLTVKDIIEHLSKSNARYLILIIDAIINQNLTTIDSDFKYVMLNHKENVIHLAKFFQVDTLTMENYLIELYNTQYVREHYINDTLLEWAFIQSEDYDDDILIHECEDFAPMRHKDERPIPTSGHVTAKVLMSVGTFVVSVVNTCLLMYIIQKRK